MTYKTLKLDKFKSVLFRPFKDPRPIRSAGYESGSRFGSENFKPLGFAFKSGSNEQYTVRI